MASPKRKRNEAWRSPSKQNCFIITFAHDTTHAWRMPKQFVLVSTDGFSEMETFDPLIAMFRA
jgi:hypothetical protein